MQRTRGQYPAAAPQMVVYLDTVSDGAEPGSTCARTAARDDEGWFPGSFGIETANDVTVNDNDVVEALAA